MKTSKRKANHPDQNAPVIHSPKLPPTLEQIRQRAHEIYQARGDAPGRELDDWLQAERELKTKMGQLAEENPANPHLSQD
jgi:hypothetical protein